MKLHVDYYDPENSEIDSLFVVSKLITTYYVVTLPKLYIYKYSNSVNRAKGKTDLRPTANREPTIDCTTM